MAEKRKREVITFKADPALSRELKGLGNRSSFIRDAILAALESACPLCRGTGILTPDQKKHWDAFAESHSVHQCADCHAFHLVCSHPRRRSRR